MNARGFTLVELLTAMAVATLLLTFGVTGFSSFSASQNATAAANRLLADVFLARVAASQRAGEIALARTTPDWRGGWSVTAVDGDSELVLADATGLETLDRLAAHRAADGPAVDRIVFGAYGELEQPAGGVVFDLCTRGERRLVEVAGSGNASIRRLPKQANVCD